jgi:hypothetical protein
MTNNTFNNTSDTFDPYDIDHQGIIDANNKKATSKVNWHNLPEGAAASTWRLLPYVQKRSFFFKLQKHWNVPGFDGSITCPRSFDDPSGAVGKKLRCSICEKRWNLEKSSNEADQTIAKEVLRSSVSYYTNALSVDHLEKGIGVLNLPHAVWKHLMNWLALAQFQSFSHPVRGFNILIQSTIVSGTSIPGQKNRAKREYTITPLEPNPISDPSILEHLYDLEFVVGIPTFEFTDLCLQRILTKDETLQLPDGTPRYRQLTEGTAADTDFDFGGNGESKQVTPPVSVNTYSFTATGAGPTTVNAPAFAVSGLATSKPVDLSSPTSVEEALLKTLRGGK